MGRFAILLGTGLAGLMIYGCRALAESAAPAAASSPAPPVDLRAVAERYWDEQAVLAPWYSWGSADDDSSEALEELIAPQALADSLTLQRRYLAQLQGIDPSRLSAQAQLTYRLLLRECELAIEGATFPSELLPIDPYDGLPARFALLETAAERLGSASGSDYDNWLRRTEYLVRWMDQAVSNLRDGLRRGYTLPQVVVNKALPALAMLGADNDQNPFVASIQSPDAAPERRRWAAAMRQEVANRVLPAYRNMHDFLEHDYLPRARTSVALSALPLGDAWYIYLAKRYSGSTATPAQWHARALAEIERLQQRLRLLLGDTSAQDFYEHIRTDPRFAYKSGGELLTAYQELKIQVDAAVPSLFRKAPRGDFVIHSVEAYRSSTAPPLSYRPRAPNGMSAAVLYVNTAGLDGRPATAMTAEFLREAVPGHHYQVELQRERTDLPRLRRFAGTAAFVQGWGLYAASLGDSLGLYSGIEAKFGALVLQLDCAAGMAVDTGMHAMAWSRSQAVSFVRAQVPGDEVAAEDMVDRAIAHPAAALACTAGYLELARLRQLVEHELGSRFEAAAFHDEVLRDGAMPLTILEVKIRSWIEEVGAAALIAPVSVPRD